MNTPYGIYGYDFSNFCAYLAFQTNTNYNYISQKTQVKYIHKYLEYLSKEDENLFIICENEYIDKNYMDDFSSYYVNCFSQYKKTTSRVHFFKYKKNDVCEDFEMNEKRDILLNSYLEKELTNSLKGIESIINGKNYLGFIVIRPIPKTFLAKVCLKPFHFESNNKLEKFYLLKNYDVSLFGISLSIQSIAFQEQDKVLSACATTSLWSFFHAHNNTCLSNIPSSSEITKNAYTEINGHSREFPNSGLTTEMICRSLRSQNFSPEYFEFKKENTSLNKQRLQEYIYAYCSSDMPLILGVTVKESLNSKNLDLFQKMCSYLKKNKNTDTKGLHAVTVLGYALSNSTSSNLISHALEKIYVHDDRYGPFMRMILDDNNKFKVQLDKDNNSGLIDREEIYEVDTLIIGLYHKIRIPYIHIKNTCISLIDNLKDILPNMEGSPSDNKEIESFKMLLTDIKWNITVKENASLKSDLIKKEFANKEYHLTKSLPKYLWSATAFIDNNGLFELLFDATDIDQSEVFIDFIQYTTDEDIEYYSGEIRKIVNFYAKYKIQENVINLDILDDKEENYINGIINYFNEDITYKDSLDEIFGYLKIPGYIKDQETSNYVINNGRIFRENIINTEKFELDDDLSEDSKYIWLIDREGFLCIGEEHKDSVNGHPTLTKGKPARIGGELLPKSDEEGKRIWEINTRSGRYSKKYTDGEKERFVKNALNHKFRILFKENEFKLEE